MAHIWACPPAEGDDYIFHIHPSEQKVPKPRRLAEWYCKMLDLALEANVIRDYRELLADAQDSRLESVAQLPYFEGDFWPNAIEDLLKQLASKQQRRLVDVPSAEITRRLYELFERHNGVFFVVRLSPTPLPETLDPDPLVHCELIELRDNLICLAREKHFEFSSCRRTKYSSMMILYELHTQRDEYTCNQCSTPIDARYHCATCDDFDLCAACYEEDSRSEKPHPHPLEKVGFELVTPQKQLKSEALVASTSSVHIVQTSVNCSSPSRGTHGMSTVAGIRSSMTQEKLAALVHACICLDEKTCGVQLCEAMKRLLDHFRDCTRRQVACCSICKQLYAMLADHSRQCTTSADPATRGTCPVPQCLELRQRSMDRDRYRRATEQNYQMRRMAAMNWSSSGAAMASAVSVAPPALSSSHAHASSDLRVPSASTLSIAIRLDAIAPSASSISPLAGQSSSVNLTTVVPALRASVPHPTAVHPFNRSPIASPSSISPAATALSPRGAPTGQQMQSFVVSKPMPFTQFMRSRSASITPAAAQQPRIRLSPASAASPVSGYRSITPRSALGPPADAATTNVRARLSRLIRPAPPFTQLRHASTALPQLPFANPTSPAPRPFVISRASTPRYPQVCAHFPIYTEHFVFF